MDAGATSAAARKVPYSIGRLARAFFEAGSQSVGGGASTIALTRHRLVGRFGWLTDKEFSDEWALSRLSLGIHNVALAGLLGQRVGGLRGAAVAVGAMLVPAAVIAALLTGGYDVVRDQPLVRAAFSGIAPVVIGLTVGMSLTFAHAQLRRGRRSVVDVTVVVLAMIASTAFPSAPLQLILAGFIGGALFLGHEGPPGDEEGGLR